MSKKWPSGKDAKPPTKTPVKYYPGLGYAPVRQAKHRPLKGEQPHRNV